MVLLNKILSIETIVSEYMWVSTPEPSACHESHGGKGIFLRRTETGLKGQGIHEKSRKPKAINPSKMSPFLFDD